MSLVDNAIAYKILHMLVKKFDETKAFELGLIDKSGNKLKDPVTDDEKNAYDLLDRLVFSLKRIIEKLPGGKTKLASLIAAYWLVKEAYETGNRTQLESRFHRVKDLMEKGVVLVEEEILVKKFISEELGGVAANATSGAQVNNPDAVAKKNVKKYVQRRKNVVS
jgi:hypothetical protein